MPASIPTVFKAPWWLPGGHAQTIAPALLGRRLGLETPWVRERWTAPDGDFIDVDRLQAAQSNTKQANEARPLLVLFHGLEGSSASHYALGFAHACTQVGWDCAVPHFRGCSGPLNLGPRAYHSGDHEEVDWVLRQFQSENPKRPLLAVGVSLGGNALACWAAEQGAEATRVVRAAASIGSPLDLTASGMAMGRGINQLVYTRMFLSSMVPKALLKLDQHPGLFDKAALVAAQNLLEFDDVFTGPVHGYANALDYWRRASAKPRLSGVRLPLLLLNARNDPFVPASSLPSAAGVSSAVTLWQPPQGGHVGFPVGGVATERQHWLMAAPHAVVAWLNTHAG